MNHVPRPHRDRLSEGIAPTADRVNLELHFRAVTDQLRADHEDVRREARHHAEADALSAPDEEHVHVEEILVLDRDRDLGPGVEGRGRGAVARPGQHDERQRTAKRRHRQVIYAVPAGAARGDSLPCPASHHSSHDRLAAVTPRHEPPAPDAVARDRGDDRRALAGPSLRAGVRLPAGGGAPGGPPPPRRAPPVARPAPRGPRRRPVVVTFESDWRKAKQILGKIAVKHAEHLTAQAEQDLLAASQQYLINYRKLTPIVYTKVVNDGVQLTIRYLIEPRKRRGTEHAIWEEILTEFGAAPDIDLAYHTTRGFKYTEEGKPALRAPPITPLQSGIPVDDG